MLDPRYQYALHTTSYEEQPLSDKTLSRFRKRCYDYEAAYGVELLYTCVAKLVICFHKNGQDEFIKGFEHYYDPNDYNKTFYYNASSGTEEQLRTILEDADRLLSMCGSDYDEVTE